ncbi:MAG TPA: prepilin peptidase [Candidatus Nanoarchaeia archaeon]|nr:prepilin peptidase [Candidatus Nanoarchaeia archaeon]
MIIWIFLSIIVGIWLVFGAVQDLRSKEVANWVTLSLIGIGFFARLFYGIETKDWNVLFMGVLSFAVLFVLSLAFYYGKVFAGGDTKLLRGLSLFIPGTTINQVLTNIFIFILALLVLGAIYSFLFSIRIAFVNKKSFIKEFEKKIKLYYLSAPIVFVLAFMSFKLNDAVISCLSAIISFTLLCYPYFVSVDKCMNKLYSPKKLTAGDWLQQDVRIGNKTIKATVHGLSEKEIDLLIKANKKVLIKEGIPFVPVFLLTYLFMVFFFLFGQHWLVALT